MRRSQNLEIKLSGPSLVPENKNRLRTSNNSNRTHLEIFFSERVSSSYFSLAQIEQIECGSSPCQTQLLRMVKFCSCRSSFKIWQGRKFAAFAAAIKIWQSGRSSQDAAFAAAAATQPLTQLVCLPKFGSAAPLTHAHEVAPVDHNGYYVNLKVEKNTWLYKSSVI